MDKRGGEGGEGRGLEGRVVEWMEEVEVWGGYDWDWIGLVGWGVGGWGRGGRGEIGRRGIGWRGIVGRRMYVGIREGGEGCGVSKAGLTTVEVEVFMVRTALGFLRSRGGT